MMSAIFTISYFRQSLLAKYLSLVIKLVWPDPSVLNLDLNLVFEMRSIGPIFIIKISVISNFISEVKG